VRFTLGLPLMHHPISESFLSGDAIAEIAKAAESAGFESVWLTEHPAPPDRWLENGGHDSLDPFVALAFAAAATTKLRLLTNLTVLPYRNPFLLAKAVATLDRLSGGRVTLGVGTGYLKGEYRALGVDFDQRNVLFDQSIEILREAWSGESVVVDGAGLSTRGTTSLPTPEQNPVPIWIGGNSQLTRRRVVAVAQGWMPMWNPTTQSATTRTAPLETFTELRTMIGAMRSDAVVSGRTDHLDVAITPPPGSDIDVGFTESIRRLAGAGVDVAVINLPADGDFPEEVARFGREVIVDPVPETPAKGGLGRFTVAARELGVEVVPVTYPQGTRTAADAAAAIGCEVSQIVKSLVVSSDHGVALALTAGHHRIDLVKLSAIAGHTMKMAGAEQARAATGYAIGGTPPFGHSVPMPIYIDPALFDHQIVYGAAGRPDTCFPIAPDVLARVTGAIVADFVVG